MLDGRHAKHTVFHFLFYAAINNVFAESCWQSAAQRYGIHKTILRAIALTESVMDSQAINRNPNGSVDVGLMQINSRWFPRLAEIGIQPGDLWNPCTNIHVGASPELLQGRVKIARDIAFTLSFLKERNTWCISD